jgi:hypothetical protein
MLALPARTFAQPSGAKDGDVSRDLEAASTSRAAVTSTFTYQGVLEENGQPVDGNRQMTFTLYSDDTCSTMVGSSIMQTVTVNDSLFAVQLGFAGDLFNGQALWLQTQVEGTNVACQPLQTAPYANTLRPGAMIKADVASEDQLLDIRSGETSPDEGVLGAKLGGRSSVGYPIGVFGYGFEYGGTGVWGESDGEFGWGVNGVAQGNESIGVRGIANALTTETYGVYGEASSPDGYGGYFLNTTTSEPGWGLAAEGVIGASITGTNGTGLKATASGDSGEHGDDGVRGIHSVGDGVVGESEGTGNLDNGVIGFSAGGYGVYGFSNAAGQYAGYFGGPIRAGGCTGCTTRYVARNVSDTTLRLGDVVSAAGVDTRTGSEQPVILTAPATKGDSVLGVVVGRTTMTIADDSEDDVKPGPHYGPTGGPAAPGEYVVVVVQGMAQVRVAADEALATGEHIGLGANGATRAERSSSFGMVLDEAGPNGLVWALLGAL